MAGNRLSESVQAPAATGLRDALNRPIHDLRVSVIDNCNMRCTYCMPLEEFGERYQFLNSQDLLSFDEITRLTQLFVSIGVRKIRLTGGEPLLRRGLPDLVAGIDQLDGVEDIALTTNGVLLRRNAQALRQAGLKRITVSLDSLDEEIFARMNGRGLKPEVVLDGIDAALEAGFTGIKVNVVIQKDVNDSTAANLAAYFKGRDCIVRFIEFMDVGNRNDWRMRHIVPSKEIVDRIHARFPLRALEKNYRGEVASRYAYEDGSGEIGFISSVTEPFCGSCTRARISADGQLFTCLFAGSGTDLRGPLRSGASEAELVGLLKAVWTKREDRYSEVRSSLTNWEQHAPKVEMYQIGG